MSLHQLALFCLSFFLMACQAPANVSETDLTSSSGGCMVAGCSGQLCVEAGSENDTVTTCEWREEYACYETAHCERQADGECGWTQTEELTSCLALHAEDDTATGDVL